ncbi:oligopeptide transporter [Penicillium pulvis]|uniref:oligopeptide transporter n=1 Tax=Penicillium pulvis TaxID=1562058 RepID=UPI0025480240|nr:oligopeptide transporter [Penicillium pulvis]KAJ5802680.1 oligopeptide transporter [Penicillium pulvis]
MDPQLLPPDEQYTSDVTSESQETGLEGNNNPGKSDSQKPAEAEDDTVSDDETSQSGNDEGELSQPCHATPGGMDENPMRAKVDFWDFQIQLMVLEQQNKRRLMIARHEQERLRGYSIKGILGLGQATATRINYTFTTIVYLLSMFTGVVADGWWGKYRMIKWATAVYLAGLAIILLTTIPPAMKAGAAPAGYVTGLVLIAIGLGGCQSTIVPFIADQYEKFSPRTKVTTKGQQVVITRDKTLTYIYSLYFWSVYEPLRVLDNAVSHLSYSRMVNVGSLSSIATTLLEEKVGFWAAYIITFACMLLSVILLHIGDTAFALWLCIFQASANRISQAAQMETMGIPNDAMKTSNAMALVILGIAVEKWLYPALENRKIQFKPMARITVGLLFMTLGIAYGTAVQVMIYHAGPCYQYPTECGASENGLPNHINVMVTLPMYMLIALAEIFAFVTGNEYAYKQAPKDMKSVMQSIYALMTAIVLGIALSPLSQNPLLIVSWGTVTGIMFVVTCFFWVIFHKHDRI